MVKRIARVTLMVLMMAAVGAVSAEELCRRYNDPGMGPQDGVIQSGEQIPAVRGAFQAEVVTGRVCNRELEPLAGVEVRVVRFRRLKQDHLIPTFDELLDDGGVHYVVEGWLDVEMGEDGRFTVELGTPGHYAFVVEDSMGQVVRKPLVFDFMITPMEERPTEE